MQSAEIFHLLLWSVLISNVRCNSLSWSAKGVVIPFENLNTRWTNLVYGDVGTIENSNDVYVMDRNTGLIKETLFESHIPVREMVAMDTEDTKYAIVLDKCVYFYDRKRKTFNNGLGPCPFDVRSMYEKSILLTKQSTKNIPHLRNSYSSIIRLDYTHRVYHIVIKGQGFSEDVFRGIYSCIGNRPDTCFMYGWDEPFLQRELYAVKKITPTKIDAAFPGLLLASEIGITMQNGITLNSVDIWSLEDISQRHHLLNFVDNNVMNHNEFFLGDFPVIGKFASSSPYQERHFVVLSHAPKEILVAETSGHNLLIKRKAIIHDTLPLRIYSMAANKLGLFILIKDDSLKALMMIENMYLADNETNIYHKRMISLSTGVSHQYTYLGNIVKMVPMFGFGDIAVLEQKSDTCYMYHLINIAPWEHVQVQLAFKERGSLQCIPSQQITSFYVTGNREIVAMEKQTSQTALFKIVLLHTSHPITLQAPRPSYSAGVLTWDYLYPPTFIDHRLINGTTIELNVIDTNQTFLVQIHYVGERNQYNITGSNLPNNKEITARLRVSNWKNASLTNDFGLPITFMYALVPSPQELTYHRENHSLTWYQPPGLLPAHPIVKYTIRCDPRNDLVPSLHYVSVERTGNWLHLELISWNITNHTMSFTAMSHSDIQSSEVTVLVQLEPPESPHSLRIVDKHYLRWRPPKRNIFLELYKIEIRGENYENIIQVNKDVNKVDLSHKVPFDKVLNVTVISLAGLHSVPSDTIEFRIDALPPPVQLIFSQSSLTISWKQRNFYKADSVEEYEVTCLGNSCSWRMFRIAAKTRLIETYHVEEFGLEAAKYYYLSVVAIGKSFARSQPSELMELYIEPLTQVHNTKMSAIGHMKLELKYEVIITPLYTYPQSLKLSIKHFDTVYRRNLPAVAANQTWSELFTLPEVRHGGFYDITVVFIDYKGNGFAQSTHKVSWALPDVIKSTPTTTTNITKKANNLALAIMIASAILFALIVGFAITYFSGRFKRKSTLTLREQLQLLDVTRSNRLGFAAPSAPPADNPFFLEMPYNMITSPFNKMYSIQQFEQLPQPYIPDAFSADATDRNPWSRRTKKSEIQLNQPIHVPLQTTSVMLPSTVVSLQAPQMLMIGNDGDEYTYYESMPQNQTPRVNQSQQVIAAEFL